MSRQAAAEEREELTYDERMDRMVSRLDTTASEDRKKQRYTRVISVALLVLLGLAIYLWVRQQMRQATATGEFMRFVTDLM